MKVNKKYVIAGAIGVVSIAAALAYLQYKKLMNYVIKVYKANVNNLTINNLNFNLLLNFTNNSNIGFTIEKQIINAYINEKFVAKIENNVPSVIKPNSTSIININVDLNPSKVLGLLSTNITNILLRPETVRIKLDIKLRVKLWFFRVNLPFVFDKTLKEIKDMKKEK